LKVELYGIAGTTLLMLYAKPGSEGKGGGHQAEFALTLALFAIFVGLFVVTEDPYSLGSVFQRS